MFQPFFSALILLVVSALLSCQPADTNETTESETSTHPNIVIIYLDDLGYGDVSSYGATEISTPNIDRLAGEGQRFTDAHTTSATCTPSRYGLLTGQYPWRKDGTGIARGEGVGFDLVMPVDTGLI